MFLVILQVLTAIVLLVAMLWWTYCRRPTLRAIRLRTNSELLITHEASSTGFGISVWVSGKTFKYHYVRKHHGDNVFTKLTVSFPIKIPGRPKNALIAEFRNDQIEQWVLAEGGIHTSPSYEELFILGEILQTVENAAPYRRRNEVIA